MSCTGCYWWLGDAGSCILVVSFVWVFTILYPLQLVLEKAMAPHSSTLAWKTPWAEEPGRLQSMGSWRVGHDWATSLSLFTFMHWRRKWQPTPVFLPGESQGWGSLVSFCLWGCKESDTTEATQQQQQQQGWFSGSLGSWSQCSHSKGSGLDLEFCLVLYILFHWSGTPVCSQLVLCMHFCVWRCIPDVPVERDVLHVHLLLCHLVLNRFHF